MLKDWKDTFDIILKDIEPKLNAARQILEKSDKAEGKLQAARKLYEDAKYNADFVKIGKGVHNPFYAAELIQVADRNLDRLFRTVGQSAPALPDKSPIKGGYCAQLCHDKAGVKLPIVTSFQGSNCRIPVMPSSLAWVAPPAIRRKNIKRSASPKRVAWPVTTARKTPSARVPSKTVGALYGRESAV